jgi:hypothetical protein
MKTRIVLDSNETFSFTTPARNAPAVASMVAEQDRLAALEIGEVPGRPGHFFIPGLLAGWSAPVNSALNDL